MSSYLTALCCPSGGVGCCCPYDGFNDDGDGAVSVRSGTHSTWSSSPMRSLEERLVPVEVQRKIVVLGFRGVGKSALIARFVDNQFVEAYEPTIEYTFRTTLMRNNVRFVCDVLDTSAQDEYSSLSRQASVGVHGYILVYSSTSRTSFENIKVIHEKVLNVIGGQTIPMVLVGTKYDMEEYREVQSSEGQALAAKLGYPFVECSARTSWNVEQVFSTLLGCIEKDSGLLSEEREESCAIL